MSPKSSSTTGDPTRFPTPNKAKPLSSPRGPHDRRNSESSMSSMNNFNNPPSGSRPPRTLEEIREDPKFKKTQSEFREAVRKALAPRTSRTRQYKNPKVKRKLPFNVPEEESQLMISGPASKISVSNVAKQAEEAATVPIPTNISNLFSDLDSQSEKLSQNDQRKLQRAHSMANSVMSYSNNNPTKVQTMYNVHNNLQQLHSKLNNKVKVSVEQLRVISKLEKELERQKEKHRRATALIKEFKMDVPVPIAKIVKNTTEINKLTKEMEKLKKGGDLNRSRLLGQIVSLAKKQRAAMGALSNMKTMTVTKNKNVTEMKLKLKEYATAVEKYESRIKELLKSPKSTKSAQTQTKFTKQVTAPPKVTTAVKTITNEHIRKIVKQETNARVPTTPPGFTKTNIERLLQPFKQPVSVKFAPTISVKGGSAKSTLEQVQIQHKSPVDKKKKKPLKLTRGPATARKQESAKFRNAIISKLRSPVAAKRREALYSLRTPTTGQRKKHVIELIDRVLRRMKVRADVEKKLIKFYESLSERHIKQLFGGRTKEEVKTILKKQVDYFSKKR